ncbi:Gamma-interferon-inducible protein [Dirofilaria immitis]
MSNEEDEPILTCTSLFTFSLPGSSSIHHNETESLSLTALLSVFNIDLKLSVLNQQILAISVYVFKNLLLRLTLKK